MSDVEPSEEHPPTHQVSGKGDKSSSSSRKASTTVTTRSRRTASPSRSSKHSDGPLTPESPPFRLTRKRAASLADKADAEAQEEVEDEVSAPHGSHSRMSSGGSGASAGSATSHVCLCQPDPKIPRPRNAFILYRQHHQAAIVAQHPGLANPEISKIIGEQWKAQPESVRNEWKTLAEEEKLRHQQQYPEYRYQPRRGGRRGSLSNTGAFDKTHCHKCGGRSITTSTTPFVTTTPSAVTTPMLPPPTPSSALTPTSRYLPPMMSNLAINPGQIRRNRQAPSPLTNIHAVRNREDDNQMVGPISPDTKRRRYNQAYVPPSARPVTGTPYPFPPDPRRHSQSLPRPELLRGPSPRSAVQQSPQLSTPGQHDSLTLPPLQTGSDPQSRSVEAMVMSMPFWGKIRVLGRIAPPFRGTVPSATTPTSASASSPTPARGAIIAIEGDDKVAVTQMSSWLEGSLNRGGECFARVADAPHSPAADPRGKNSNEYDRGNGKGSKNGGSAGVSLGDYVQVISEWHGKTSKMIDFITTMPSPPPGGANNNAERTPVLILPTYNLHATNAWASRIPITDNYSPADHWQWVATLWRGIIGPDITVYVRDMEPAEMEIGSAGGSGSSRAVEVREDGQTKCLIVKRVGKEIEDSALRRLGFEVGELIRSVGMKGGV